ncbi:hypothetical protein GGS24DRAFT_501750 [Hypoxylon argillaceum]|nr:hypothetical protein GGS24DRAFT_501750 [Hypoxylon argillaceum]
MSDDLPGGATQDEYDEEMEDSEEYDEEMEDYEEYDEQMEDSEYDEQTEDSSRSEETDEQMEEPSRSEDSDGEGQTIDANLDQGTYGVELEFLVVLSPRIKEDGDNNLVAEDPHPNEPRWLSTKLTAWDLNGWKKKKYEGEPMAEHKAQNGTYFDKADTDWESRTFQYARTKLTRILRDSGLTVIKWREVDDDVDNGGHILVNDFSESEDSDDEREKDYHNRDHLSGFASSYVYDPARAYRVHNNNRASAVKKWYQDFLDYHNTHNLEVYRTRSEDIESLLHRCSISGWPDRLPVSERNYELEHARERLQDLLGRRRDRGKQARENERNKQVDPLHVRVPGLSRQYKAWTVTYDTSVDGNGMNASRYANAMGVDPFNEYTWFGAEVVSPVLPLGDELAREAIRTACGSLRENLRCHKPMEVSTGLHVHIGHTKGWTLLQAKRFATLWFLAEGILLGLHRKDRDFDNTWCAKIRGGSLLWLALYSDDSSERQHSADTMQANHPAAEKLAYEAQMAEHVSTQNLTTEESGFLYYVWQYKTIDKLREGLGDNKYRRMGVRWRIRGLESSLDPPPLRPWERKDPGTIEVRIMQGTLDADHINNWVTVLEHIAHQVRNSSNESFRQLLTQFAQERTRDRLLQLLDVPNDVRLYWLDRKRRDSTDHWWEYPDKDLVDWGNPFMIRGHRATHDGFYDD